MGKVKENVKKKGNDGGDRSTQGSRNTEEFKNAEEPKNSEDPKDAEEHVKTKSPKEVRKPKSVQTLIDAMKMKRRKHETNRQDNEKTSRITYDRIMLFLSIFTLFVTIYIGLKANRISEVSLKVQRDTSPLIVDLDKTSEEQYSLKRQKYVALP